MVGKEINSLNDNLVLNAVFNPHEPFDVDESHVDENEMNGVDTDVSEEVKKTEIDAVNAAQDGDVSKSLVLFNQVVASAPNYASGYNNRAQLFRLQGDDKSALEDLNKAISLSHGKGLAASQAYVQRALLKQVDGDCEGSLEDFKAAAKLGNAFAKNQMVALNPYAALCNQMLGEVFSRVRNGQPDMA